MQINWLMERKESLETDPWIYAAIITKAIMCKPYSQCRTQDIYHPFYRDENWGSRGWLTYLVYKASKLQSLNLKTGLPESKSHTLLGQKTCLVCLCIPTDLLNAWHIEVYRNPLYSDLSPNSHRVYWPLTYFIMSQ